MVLCDIDDVCKDSVFVADRNLHLKIDNVDYRVSLVDATVETFKPLMERMFHLFDQMLI